MLDAPCETARDSPPGVAGRSASGWAALALPGRSEGEGQRSDHAGLAGVLARRRDEVAIGVDILQPGGHILVGDGRAETIVGIFLADRQPARAPGVADMAREADRRLRN